MATVRMLTHDVDDAVQALRASGYRVDKRMGPPFAILTPAEEVDGPRIWLSGPEASATKANRSLKAELQQGGLVRMVHETDDLDRCVKEWEGCGWTVVSERVSGPGGSQVLVERELIVWELFCAVSR